MQQIVAGAPHPNATSFLGTPALDTSYSSRVEISNSLSGLPREGLGNTLIPPVPDYCPARLEKVRKEKG